MSIVMKKKIIIIAIITVMLLTAAGGYYWHYWTGTPQYALRQIDKAIKGKKVDTALSYFDTDAIFDQMWSNVRANMVQEIINNPDMAFSAPIALQTIESLKPAYKDKTLLSLRSGLNSTTTTPLSMLIETQNNLKIDGDFASITSDDDDTTLKLKRLENGKWMIVTLESKSWFSNSDETKNNGD